MALNSIGDQARAFAMKTATTRVKNQLDVLTKELSSGEVADLGQRLGGNTKAINQIETRLTTLAQMRQNGAEIAAYTTGLQDVLGKLHSDTSALAVALLTEPVSPTPDLLATRSAEIGDSFATTVSRLNGDVAGQFLFSGLNTQQAPLDSSEAMLASLVTLTAGLTTAADVAQAVSDWFDAPVGGGGFLDNAYHGTVGAERQITVGENRQVSVSTDAASQGVRDALKGMAMGALVSKGVLAGQYDQQLQLMSRGAETLLNNETQLLSEVSRVAQAQQSTQNGQTETAARSSVLTIARNEIRSADPYETSLALKETESQLEQIYAITARLSNLKLVEYLR